MAVALFVFVLCLMACHCNIITLDSMECVYGKELCLNGTCLITVSRNNQQKINAGCYYPKPLYNLSVEVTMQRKRGRVYETLVRAKESFCEVLQHTARSQFMVRVYEHVHQYVTNLRCPFVGNVRTINLPFGLSFVPGFVPKGQYRVLTDLRNNREPAIALELMISIGPKKKVNNKKN